MHQRCDISDIAISRGNCPHPDTSYLATDNTRTQITKSIPQMNKVADFHPVSHQPELELRILAQAVL